MTGATERPVGASADGHSRESSRAIVAPGRALSLHDGTSVRDLWVPPGWSGARGLSAAMRNPCGESVTDGPVVVLGPPPPLGSSAPCPALNLASRSALNTAPDAREHTRPPRLPGAPTWAPLAGAAGAHLIPWPGGVPDGLPAVVAAFVVVWWLRCGTGRPDPRLRVWGAAAGVALLASWVGTTSMRGAGLVLLVGAVHLLVCGPWLAWQPPEDWVLSQVVHPLPVPCFRLAQQLREADAARQLTALLCGVATLGGAGLMGVDHGPVAQPAGGVVLVCALIAWLGAAGRVRGLALAWGHLAVAVGVLAVVVWRAPAHVPGVEVPVGLVLMGLGSVAALLAVLGGRAWDLVWWPRGPQGRTRWLLVLTLVAAVAASGAVEHLSR